VVTSIGLLERVGGCGAESSLVDVYATEAPRGMRLLRPVTQETTILDEPSQIIRDKPFLLIPRETLSIQERRSQVQFVSFEPAAAGPSQCRVDIVSNPESSKPIHLLSAERRRNR
jgi:hypothetical protein